MLLKLNFPQIYQFHLSKPKLLAQKRVIKHLGIDKLISSQVIAGCGIDKLKKSLMIIGQESNKLS